MKVEKARKPDVEKITALKKYHALNPSPEKVKEESFVAGAPFFDANDLVQVKYEMLRSVERDGRSVSDAAQSFGFSRPSFYHAKKAFKQNGLAGLLPEHPGPKRAHKLSNEVMGFINETVKEKGHLNSSALSAVIDSEFGISVHPRSVERALSRRKKNF